MIGAIVQARMGSTRLPGKVLMPAAGQPLLGHLLERLRACASLETIVVATTTEPADGAIADFSAARGVPVFRGSADDVLDRYRRAAAHRRISLVVRITADCPLIDPAIVDEVVAYATEHRGEYDLVTTRHPLTFPDGIDLDVIPYESLVDAAGRATSAMQREHVVPYFWESGKRVHNIEHPDGLYDRYRWTLDYPEDYQVIARIVAGLYGGPAEPFSMADVIEYVERHPELRELNAHYIVPQPPTVRVAVPRRVPGRTGAARVGAGAAGGVAS